MRAIDADALIDKYGDWYTEEGTEEGYIGTIKGIVDSMPTVQERKKGVWIVLKHSHNAMCSNCHRTFVDAYNLENWDNYCRHCGALMEGIEAEDDDEGD